MALKPILSVGVDVGTTSTHLTVSRLTLANISRPNEPSRVIIEAREILYQSPIHFTPLTDDGIIDAQGVLQILQDEYAISGIPVDEIDTGAVIITGESAKRRNASEIANALSQLAGRFVAASAGPNMESVLAARGSGALTTSKEKWHTICNVDIGGGTSNIAVCVKGQVTYTDCIPVGARFCQIDDQYAVIATTESGRELLQQCCADGIATTHLSIEQARELSREAALRILTGITNSERETGALNQVWFSGGVGETMRRLSHPNDQLPLRQTEYGDMGVFLAEQLLALCKERSLDCLIAPNAIRATVIGAGSHSLQLSGSTVGINNTNLPLTNLPIIRLPDETTPVSLANSLRTALHLQDLDWRTEPIALLLPAIPRMGIEELRMWAKALCGAFVELEGQSPFTLIISHDVAAALSQAMRRELPTIQCVILDGIGNTTGDFVDIGAMLTTAQSIPVVIKEFVFN